MAAVPFVKGAVGLFRAVGKATGFWRQADHLGDAVKGLCRLTSFVGGTTVETPDGPIPIEQLRPGDQILTRDDADPATLAPEPGYVKHIFKRIAPAVVWLTLLDGTTIGVTPEHEVYTEAQGWRYVSELEASASLVDATGAPLTVVAIEVDPTPRAVYNLETSCGTYFAQGVWAHNCFDRHHAFAKFLGGDPAGILVGLERTLHRQYHGGLLRQLGGLGKPRDMKWAQFFAQNPDRYKIALDRMVNYTRDFDRANGTDLLSSVWRQMASQWW